MTPVASRTRQRQGVKQPPHAVIVACVQRVNAYSTMSVATT